MNALTPASLPSANPGLKARVLAKIEAEDFVSFDALGRAFPQAFTGGGYALALRHNLFLWLDLQPAGAAVLHELRHVEHRIIYEPFPSMVAFLAATDGGYLALPLAKTVRDYAKPHWLPVAIRPYAPGLASMTRTLAEIEARP
jgi:hypothetical protein